MSGRCFPSIRMVALQLHAIFILRLESLNHEDWRPDSWTSAAHYFYIKACASGPWRLTFRRLNFVCTTYLIKDSIRTVVAVFPYLCFGTKSFSLSNTERRPAMLLRHPDWCNLEQFEASRHRGRSGWKVLIVRTDDALTVKRLDKILHRPDGCKGSDCSYLESVQSLLEV
jgi:hypothetical protein